MTFADAAAAMARPLAESQMTSVGHYFDLGAPVTDGNGNVTRPESNPHSTKCRVRPATMRDFHSEAAAEELFASNYVVSIPFELTPPPTVKQHFKIDSSPDPSMVGIELQIRQVSYGDHVSARRMLCFKVT